MRTRPSSSARPLCHSLARCGSALAVAAALQLASSPPSSAALITWDSGGGDALWTTPQNWLPDVVPTITDDVTFGTGGPLLVQINGDQAVNSLTFNSAFTLGSFGTSDTLRNESGNVSVLTGVMATINASYAGNAGLNLSGGGTLFLNHPAPRFLGDVTVDGATLMVQSGATYPQVNGTAAVNTVGRQDFYGVGFGPLKSINLQNGGEFKLIGAGANPDGATKNFVLSTGAGAINVSSGYQQITIDDANQIAGSGDLVKNGKGRLIFPSQDYNLTGNPTVNAGILDLNRLQGGSTTANTRFSTFSGTTDGNASTLTVRTGGALVLNNGTVGNLDIATVVAADGGILGTQGNGHEIGLRAGGNVLNITGTASMLHRDFFGVQTGRNFFINSDITGNGTLVIHPSTQAASASRIVIQRASPAANFSGVFRMLENANLEAHPRFNEVANVGKVIANGDVEFAGWGNQLDVRDSDPAGANVKDYAANDLLVTGVQLGNLHRTTVIRATATTGTGHIFNFGTLRIGDHRMAIEGNNSYIVGLANTASVRGNTVIEMRTAPLIFNNAVAVAEDAAGRTLTFVKNGAPNTTGQEVTSTGSIGVSNLHLAFGTLNLRSAAGAIGTGFGGAAPTIIINGGDPATATRGNPTQGILNLDSNGVLLGVSSGNNNDRIVDSATVRMHSNSVLRLTSLSNTGTTETVGTLNVVGGHARIDVVKTGAAPSPVGFTLNTLNLSNSATMNFTGTGTTLGVGGPDTTRVVIPNTAAGFMGSRFHVANEWAKYDATADNGLALGVIPFAAADYIVGNPETDWAAGQHNKQTVTPITLTANRTVETLNLQPTATQTIALDVNRLTFNAGGLLTSGSSAGFTGNIGADGTTTAGLTAGTTAPTQLYAHTNAQLDLKLPVVNNAGPDGIFGNADDQSVDFVKSGTGTIRLTHQSLGVAVGNQGGSVAPFTTPTWTSTLTGSWVINDGALNVHRGQFLGGRPVVLNGGALEINQPVAAANANSILPGWGNNVTVNGNATLGSDDNGESADAGVGGNTIPLLGSLTINNNATLAVGAFNGDIAFMNGGTLNGRGTLNLGIGRSSSANHALILSGALTGAGGLDVVSYTATAHSLVIGGTQSDTAHNTFTGPIVAYGANATIRLNKANGFDAIPNTAVDEDLVINGSSVLWGPAHHGDLATTNDLNVTNNGLFGIAPLSPAAIKNAGMNQINDAATVTLLLGTLGEGDRITNERWGTLNQKNGTLNAGLGRMEVDVANISGGNFSINNGGTFRAGTLNLFSGAYSPNITTGLLGNPATMTTLEIGGGGLNMNGQNIILGGGSNTAVAGAGAVLKLGGNVTATGDVLNGNSYQQGIYIQLGNSFRELGNSRVDMLGGERTFTIAEDVQFYVTAPIVNGGLVKTGAGALNLTPHQPSSFAGAVTVNSGVLTARANGAFGTSAGGVTINSGGTIRLESGWTYGDNFTVSGPGAIIPNSGTVREIGALISETGTNRITGSVAVSGDATIASNTSLVQAGFGAGASNIATSHLVLSSAAGITGAGTLTLSGAGDGSIAGGINTTSGGLNKDGGGRWILSGASTFSGQTLISAGILRIGNDLSLGTVAGGTTVFGGGALELPGGLTVLEPLTAYGDGAGVQSGALVNAGGTNTYNGPITLGSDATLTSQAGQLVIGATSGITGNGRTLTLGGAGSGEVRSGVATGTGGLTKTGRGTWSLTGSNTFTGPTNLVGGLLELDYATNNTSKLSSTSPINGSGGALVVSGASSATTTQTIGGLNLVTGGTAISVRNGTLALGAITRTPGSASTVNFGLTPTGTVTTTTAATNGILGGYATVNGVDWATRTGANVTAFTGYVPLSSAPGTNTSNSRVSGKQVLRGSVTTNSLKIDGDHGLDVGLEGLTLTSGGLLYAGSARAYITGAGTLGAATPDDELVIHTSAGTLDIGTPLIGLGQGGLVKAGNGRLILRGDSGFAGPITLNEGTISIVGPGGTTHPTALGTASGPRFFNINGGTFQLVGNYDPGAANIFFNIGHSGATFRVDDGGQITINDGPGQLQGPGDITYTGGGRYFMSGGNPQFPDFTGNIFVDGGILTVGNAAAVGRREEQTITLKANSVLVNNATTGIGSIGLLNNLVLEGGAALHSLGGNRAFAGDVRLSGTNTIGTFERENPGQAREVYLAGRVSGTGVTLNVFGSLNTVPFYLSSGSNDLSGTINLGTNAALEARLPGSLGTATGAITLNMGINSRLLLRYWQNADFLANVVVNGTAELNSDRLVNYGSGSSQLLSINDLTVNTPEQVTFAGGNAYTTRIAGTATFNSNALINSTLNALFENGITFAAGATTLDKRGGGTFILQGPSTNTGATIVRGGFFHLQGANGSLPNTSSIELRAGEFRVDNSSATNSNRINDAATLLLAGGTLRVSGAEAALGQVSADPGNSIVVFNQPSETTPIALTLPGLAAARARGATVQFQTDFGPFVGATSFGQPRVSSRIVLPGQTDVPNGDIIPWAFGANGLDFVRYDGTNFDGGVARGVIEYRNTNSGSALNPTYTQDPLETAFTNAVVARFQSAAAATANLTTTLTASRTLRAMKLESGDPGTTANATNRRLDLNGNTLTIQRGSIITATQPFHIGSTAANANLTSGSGELIFHGNNTTEVGNTTTKNGINGLPGNIIITDNFGPDGVPGGGDDIPVSVVKSGTGTLQLRSLTASADNAYTGGLYVNGGTVEVWRGALLGKANNIIRMVAGVLNLNIPDVGTDVNLPGFGQSVQVLGNSVINLDNNGETAGLGTDNNIALGSLTISNGHTLGIRGFDAYDLSFTDASITGGGVIDLPQTNTGGNLTTVTIGGVISGTGVNVTSTGNTASTAAVLQLGSGDAVANTFTGKLLLPMGGLQNQPVVQLNKAAGTTAVPGDIELNSGQVHWLADNQVPDTSRIILNFGTVDFLGRNETIGSVTMRGGLFRTNSVGQSAPTDSVVNVTGDFDATGASNTFGVDGVQVNSSTTLNIGGVLRLAGYSRGVLGGDGTTVLNLNGLEMTGTVITQNTGGGSAIIRLNGNVTTFASEVPAVLGNTTDVDNFVELNGTRTFNVADGPAGLDFSLASLATDSLTPAAAGGIIKAGPGTMQIQGGGTVNNYTGPTMINEGSVILFKNTGTSALGLGPITVGDGAGGAQADKLVIRNSDQIDDASTVNIASSGLLDLVTYGRSEQVNAITGTGAVDLGSTSILTIGNSASATFAGVIHGGGALTKSGTGTFELTGTNLYVGATTVTDGTLLINGSISGSAVTAASTGVLAGAGRVGDLHTTGGTVAPGGNLAGAATAGRLSANDTTFDGGTFAIDIFGLTAGTEYDQLAVVGTFSLTSNAALQINLGSFNPADNASQSFTIIDNDGTDAVGGIGQFTFNGAPLGNGAQFVAGGQLFQINYNGGTGNDVVLLAVPEPGSAAMLLASLGALAGLKRFRRRNMR